MAPSEQERHSQRDVRLCQDDLAEKLGIEERGIEFTLGQNHLNDNKIRDTEHNNNHPRMLPPSANSVVVAAQVTSSKTHAMSVCFALAALYLSRLITGSSLK
jgi:hypothetical protein